MIKRTYQIPLIFEFEIEVENESDLPDFEDGDFDDIAGSLVSNLNISDETNDMFVDSISEWINGDFKSFKFFPEWEKPS